MASSFTREDAEEKSAEAFLAVIRNLDSFMVMKASSRTCVSECVKQSARFPENAKPPSKRGGGQGQRFFEAEDAKAA